MVSSNGFLKWFPQMVSPGSFKAFFVLLTIVTLNLSCAPQDETPIGELVARSHLPVQKPSRQKSIYEMNWKADRWFSDEQTLELCSAIEKSDLDEIQRLIDSGADVNAKGRGDMPLILWAFSTGSKVLEVLLKNGADPNIVFESSYEAPPDLIIPGCSLLYFAVLTARGDDPKFKGCVDLLLKYGADPNLGERSCLAVASSMTFLDHDKEVFYHLLDADADVNPKDYWNGRPVVNAVSHPKELQALLDRGAVYDADTPQGSELQRAVYDATVVKWAEFQRRRDKDELLSCKKWLEERGVPFDNFVPLVVEKDNPLARARLFGDQSDPRFQRIVEGQKPEPAPQKKDAANDDSDSDSEFGEITF